MEKPYTGSIAYYKDGIPYSIDGNIVLVITMKNLPEGSFLGGDDHTIIGGGAGGSTGRNTGESKALDLSYAQYRGVINNSIKLIEKLNAELKSRNDEFSLSIIREREKNNALAQHYKNLVVVKNTNVTQVAHENNRLLEEEGHRVAQIRAIQKAKEDAEVAKRTREETEHKLKETELQLKLKKAEKEKWLASLSPEVRTVEIARKSIELAKSELAKVDADIQSKHTVVTRLSGEVKEAQRRADSKPRGFSGWTNVQSKLDKALQGKKNEYAAAEKSLNIAINNRIDKLKKVTENANILKTAENSLANSQIKNAIEATVGFYESLTKNYCKKYSSLAQELANKSKGKKISNVNEALAVFEKYKNDLDKKLNKADRDAIIKALESIKYDEWAKHLDQFSKYLKTTGYISFGYDIISNLLTAYKMNDWKPLFLTLEKRTIDVGIGFVVAFVFSIIAGVTLSIFGVAIITGILCSFIDKDDLNKLNESLGL